MGVYNVKMKFKMEFHKTDLNILFNIAYTTYPVFIKDLLIHAFNAYDSVTLESLYAKDAMNH